MRLWPATLRRFCSEKRGNVAVIYAVSLVPVLVAAGGGLDYARALYAKAEMSQALDAAALAVGSSSSLSDSQALTLAQQYFNANYKATSYGTPAAVTMTRTNQTVVLSTNVSVPTIFVKLVGVDTWTVATSSTVVWGQLKLWVSLVLDNTGSMTQTDSSGTSKMSALKTASHQLLTMLQGAAQTDGDVQVAIIPFARDVKIGTGYASSSWLSFSDFIAAPATPSSSVGPGSSCPWSDGYNGYHCTAGPANGASTVSKIPSSGTYSGYICPSYTTTGHYWNGCFNSVWNWSTWSYSHTWIANATSTWSGCVTDRGTTTKPSGQAYDVTNTYPSGSPSTTLMVAENSPSCPITAMLPLGYNWTTLSNEVDAMQANGSTNQTIGLDWGWIAITASSPINSQSQPANNQRIIILLSDGLNTQNRWSGNGSNTSSDVDSRMSLACTNAKADGVTIYAVYVDIGGQGNSTVLQNCATDTSKYFDLTSSSQIVSAFTTIGQQITNLRVSQ